MAYPLKFKKSRSSKKSKKPKKVVPDPFEKLIEEERFLSNHYDSDGSDFDVPPIITHEKLILRDLRDNRSDLTNIFDDLREAPEALKIIRKTAYDSKLIALNRPEKKDKYKNDPDAGARIREQYRDMRNEHEREKLKNTPKISISELFRRAQNEMIQKHLAEESKK